MKKVILICGKLCCGKTTYAKRLAKKIHGVRLSSDDVMLSLFGQHLGDQHEAVAARTQAYLIQKSLEILEAGIPVILDFGFWKKAKRQEITAFYRRRGLKPEWHYIEIGDAAWKRNIEKRNAAVVDEGLLDYYVDEPLARKCEQLFEKPDYAEMDGWYINLLE